MRFTIRTMKTRDLRIEGIRALTPPASLLEEMPLSEAGAYNVTRAREEISSILNGQGDRLMNRDRKSVV